MSKRPSARVTPAEIRAAGSFLDQRGLSGKLTPAVLARSAKEMDKPLADVLKLVGSMLDGGAGQGPAPIAQQIAMVNPNG